MDRKTIIGLTLIFLILFFWLYVLSPRTSSPPPTIPTPSPEVKNPPAPLGIEEVGGEDLTIETPQVEVILTSLGGKVKSWRLKKYKELSVQKDLITKIREWRQKEREKVPSPELVELIPKEETINAFLAIEGPPSLSGEWDYQYLTPDKKAVKFSRITKEGLLFTKVFRFSDKDYILELEIMIQNRTSQTISNVNYRLTWGPGINYEVQDVSARAYIGPVSCVDHKVINEKGKVKEEGILRSGNISWVAFKNKYFLAAVIPQTRAEAIAVRKEGEDRFFTSLEMPAVDLGPGENLTHTFLVYGGPQEYERLQTLNADLEKIVSLGFWGTLFKVVILDFLKLLYRITRNYGLAIILWTLIIKLLIHPFMRRSFRSTRMMQVLQPQVKALREKYPKNPQKLNQETLALYRKYKVNPFGGCLPMLVQLPIFFALYSTLRNTIELRGAPFVGWITDLSQKDPYYILPILMGATSLLQQKMVSPADGGQAKFMMLLPIFFTFLFLTFPAGLTLYWFVYNVYSILEQYWIAKQMTPMQVQ